MQSADGDTGLLNELLERADDREVVSFDEQPLRRLSIPGVR
jgi:hypothetical protein